MKVLLIGNESFLCQEFIRILNRKNENYEIITTSRRINKHQNSIHLDLLSVDDFLINPPLVDVVIIFAAMTKFIHCRTNINESIIVNTIAPLKISKSYIKSNTKILFLSTNAVFDQKYPLVESLKSQNGKTKYGQTKINAEKELLNLGNKITIIRFSKVFQRDNNIFCEWKKMLVENKQIFCFNNQFISPIDSEIACEVLYKLMRFSKGGIYQFSAYNDLSYYDLCLILAQNHSLETKKVRPISAFSNGLSKNEVFKYTSLDSKRVNEELNISAPSSTQFLNYIN